MKITKEPKAIQDGVNIFCGYSELVDIERLIPNPRNPNIKK